MQAQRDECTGKSATAPRFTHADEFRQASLATIRRVPRFVDVSAHLTGHLACLHIPCDLPQVRLKDLAALPSFEIRLVGGRIAPMCPESQRMCIPDGSIVLGSHWPHFNSRWQRKVCDGVERGPFHGGKVALNSVPGLFQQGSASCFTSCYVGMVRMR